MEKIKIEPFFDLEWIMQISGESRLGGDAVQRLAKYHEQWSRYLQAFKIKADNLNYLAIWLDEKVEIEIDALWQNSPSESFMLNALAQCLCMGAVHGLMPEVEEHGCAPVPIANSELIAAILDHKLPYGQKNNYLYALRRYGVLTYLPWQGGCEICALNDSCTHKNASSKTCSPMFVELQGMD